MKNLRQWEGFIINIKVETIIKPLPTDEYILKKEKAWRVKLPVSYENFIKNYNGGMPEESSFVCNDHEYAIDRLSDNPDLIGAKLLPIATLFAGDFVCLDFKKSKENPCICVWSHEESEEDVPVTYFVSNSFEEFVRILTK